VNIVRLLLAGFIIFILVVPVSAQELPGGVFLSAGTIDYSVDTNSLSATGAMFSFHGITISSDTLRFFFDSSEIFAEGNVVLIKDGETLKGKSLHYNTKTGMGMVDDVSVRFDPINLTAESMDVVGDELILRGSRLTTCELDNPHYYLKARSLKVYLGDKIIADSVVVYFEGIPVFYFPRYQVSLKDRRLELFFPEMGYTKRSGFYFTTGLQYMFQDDLAARLKVRFATEEKISAEFSLEKTFPNATLNASIDTRGRRSVLFSNKHKDWDLNIGVDISPSVSKLPYASLSFHGFTIGAMKIVEKNIQGWKVYSDFSLSKTLPLGKSRFSMSLTASTSIYDTRDVATAASVSLGLNMPIMQNVDVGLGYSLTTTYGSSPFVSDRIRDSQGYSGSVKIRLNPEDTLQIKLSTRSSDPTCVFSHTTDCYEASLEWVVNQSVNVKIRLLDL
jgi:hypothetical protein